MAGRGRVEMGLVRHKLTMLMQLSLPRPVASVSDKPAPTKHSAFIGHSGSP
jgi:hypothetical protein